MKLLNETLSNSELNDKKISIALMASFVILTFQYLLLLNLDLIGTSNAVFIQTGSKLLVGACYLYSLPIVLKRSTNKIALVYFISIFIFLLTYLFFPLNREYLKELIFPFFFMSLPSFIYSMSIYNWYMLKKIMTIASLIVFIIGLIISIQSLMGKVLIESYSMPLSYYMLLPAILYIDELLNKYSVKNLLITIFSILIILSLGSRGAILCIITFIVLKNLRFNKNNLMYRLFILITLLFLFIFKNNILLYLYDVLLKIGIKSRSIQLFLKEEVHLSGRDNISKNIIQEIKNNPLIGIGIGGDRVITDNGYAHNIFLEILSNYGVIIGSILLMFLIMLIIKKIIFSDLKNYNILIIWFSIGFVHLMVSSSYLIDMKFWIFLGLLISCEQNYNNTINKVRNN